MIILSPNNYTLERSNVPPSQYGLWASGASYTVGEKVFVEATKGEYEALQDNSGKYPPENPDAWEWLGTANMWRMFDQFLNTYTENQDTIEVEISSFGSDGLYLANLDAKSVTVEVYDKDTNELIEEQTISLIEDPSDWLDYFYGDWIEKRKTSYLYERKTLKNNIRYKVTIDNAGDIAKCGICFVGDSEYIGDAIFDVNISALDYSKVVTDNNTGATYLEQGNYVKTLNIDVFARTSGVDQLYKILIAKRGTPCVFVGGRYETVTIYGFIKRFETVMKNSVETIVNLDLQGLI